MPNKIKMALYFGAEQVETLRAISKRTDIPMSVLVRKGIDLVIAKYSRKKTP